MIQVLKLTQNQYDTLREDTRRALIQQVYFIETPQNFYCLGAIHENNLEYWTIAKTDMGDYIGRNPKSQMPKFAEDAETIIVDKWL